MDGLLDVAQLTGSLGPVVAQGLAALPLLVVVTIAGLAVRELLSPARQGSAATGEGAADHDGGAREGTGTLGIWD